MRINDNVDFEGKGWVSVLFRIHFPQRGTVSRSLREMDESPWSTRSDSCGEEGGVLRDRP